MQTTLTTYITALFLEVVTPSAIQAVLSEKRRGDKGWHHHLLSLGRCCDSRRYRCTIRHVYYVQIHEYLFGSVES